MGREVKISLHSHCNSSKSRCCVLFPGCFTRSGQMMWHVQSLLHPASNRHLLRAMQLLTDGGEGGWREPGPLISHGTLQAVRCRRIARSSQALCALLHVQCRFLDARCLRGLPGAAAKLGSELWRSGLQVCICQQA